jgi:hypothetical protein
MEAHFRCLSPRPDVAETAVESPRHFANYRRTVGQLAVQVNELDDKLAAATKERDDMKTKCGEPCN